MTKLCQHFGACGGCTLQNVDYPLQLQQKAQTIASLFNLSPSSTPLSPYPPIPLPSPETFFYRNRMDFAFGPNYSIGLKDKKNNIINIEKCLLMSDKCNAVLNRLRYFIQYKKLKNYKDGLLRHVVIREGKNIDNCIINLLTSDKGVFPLEELWEKTKDLVNGVIWSVNLSAADRSYGDIKQFFGQDYLMESLNGLKFKIPAQSFFQTNTKQAEVLIQVVQEFAGLSGQETVLDLYSGTGSIGLSLAHKAKEVIGIEENQPAAQLSLENAKLNNIANYSALAGKVEDLLDKMNEKDDLIVLDPPRPGVSKKVITKIGRARPAKVIYVSCNPESQKHDIDKLREWGYGIEKIQPLDMFPYTPHIENVVLLTVNI
ncbi:MAG: 23S rRNA (uracil(1939)-C(5))-methyltransferase RlmD [Candidatus Margulisbacteria bacterium]|nr:23S rRNA (uracil(1939)-C(5))-methyltransferase RlmD [Candidatus Margulisiibacteriota bacterium]